MVHFARARCRRHSSFCSRSSLCAERSQYAATMRETLRASCTCVRACCRMRCAPAATASSRWSWCALPRGASCGRSCCSVGPRGASTRPWRCTASSRRYTFASRSMRCSRAASGSTSSPHVPYEASRAPSEPCTGRAAHSAGGKAGGCAGSSAAPLESGTRATLESAGGAALLARRAGGCGAEDGARRAGGVPRPRRWVSWRGGVGVDGEVGDSSRLARPSARASRRRLVARRVDREEPAPGEATSSATLDARS